MYTYICTIEFKGVVAETWYQHDTKGKLQCQKRVWIRYVIPANALVMQQEYGITTVFFL
jgi:hypothetical protein